MTIKPRMLFIITILSVSLNVQAADSDRKIRKPLKLITEAEEQPQVLFNLGQNGAIESINVYNCKKCKNGKVPADEKTRYYYENKQITPKQMILYNRQPGVVIYNLESLQATKVIVFKTEE